MIFRKRYKWNLDVLIDKAIDFRPSACKQYPLSSLSATKKRSECTPTPHPCKHWNNDGPHYRVILVSGLPAESITITSGVLLPLRYSLYQVDLVFNTAVSGMDSSRGAATGKQVAQDDLPEQLLDVFKAAALSVTKLYKTSARVEARARADGFQDCLEDLLTFLDRENIGLGDGEGWRIRRWATERLDGRETGLQSAESEDEIEKSERTSSPEVTRTSTEPSAPTQGNTTIATPPPPPPPPAVIAPVNNEPPHFVVPTQDAFTFQSSYPNIATLDLSDTRSQEVPAFTSSRNTKSRFAGSSSRPGPRQSTHLGRGAGTKRRMDFDDFFGGCLDGKDSFGNGGKRRHT
ncbi:hypothetical protein PT974_11570 [Cladobotryum mycophilum]|uniref:Uncharacterized protein n=1 Tax=Cladobotryum mycophilum TaxID=491253 RepID=A0ABR0S5J9_9HYPO